MEIIKPRGTIDLMGDRQRKKSRLINTFSTLCRSFGFEEISTPMFEQKDLYVRSVGDNTDIVEKELFILENKSESTYALRPELTAGIVRALIESGIRGRTLPIMYYSVGEFFRYDKPQKGRFRQASQLDVEIFGLSGISSDTMIINSIALFFKKLKIKDKIIFNINTLGSVETKRAYGEKLVKYLKENRDYLCSDCQRRIEKNPLRALDCKEEQCRKITAAGPAIYDSLSDEEKNDFKEIIGNLEKLKIPFNVDQNMVRGLDYYTGLIFEVNLASDLEKKLSIGGGGRYDCLVEELGGSPLPACGYALGVERIIDLVDFAPDAGEDQVRKLIVIPTSTKQNTRVLSAQNEILERLSIQTLAFLKGSSLSDALGFASKNNFDFAVIAGDEEATQDKYILKDLNKNSQETLGLNEIISKLS